MVFDHEAQRWQAHKDGYTMMPATSSSASGSRRRTAAQLGVMTFNVWFSQKNWEARQDGLLALIAEHKPDIVCLQEIKPFYLQRLEASSLIRDDYAMSEATKGKSGGPYTVMPYGCVILCRVGDDSPFKRLEQCGIYMLPSRLSRRMVSIKAVLNDDQEEEKAEEKVVWINTIHLESYKPDVEWRKKQMAKMFGEYLVLAPGEATTTSVMVMGDWNFPDHFEEYGHFPEEYADCWREHVARSKAKGEEWTELAEKGVTRKASRLDRIMLRSTTFAVERTDILGEVEMPSDHLGLITYLSTE